MTVSVENQVHSKRKLRKEVALGVVFYVANKTEGSVAGTGVTVRN